MLALFFWKQKFLLYSIVIIKVTWKACCCNKFSILSSISIRIRFFKFLFGSSKTLNIFFPPNSNCKRHVRAYWRKPMRWSANYANVKRRRTELTKSRKISNKTVTRQLKRWKIFDLMLTSCWGIFWMRFVSIIFFYQF